MSPSWKLQACQVVQLLLTVVLPVFAIDPAPVAATSTLSSAAAATTSAAPPPLGVAWNPSARAQGWGVFTSHVIFGDDVPDIDDNTLVAMARQSFNDMRNSPDYGNMARKPAMMAALKVRNEVFFASSITGHGSVSFVYDWLSEQSSTNEGADKTPQQVDALSQLGDAGNALLAIEGSLTDIEIQLIACQVGLMQIRQQTPGSRGVNDKHRTKGNCAEVIALHMYNIAHPSEGPNSIRNKNAVVVAWGVFGGEQRVVPACGGFLPIPQNWGCAKLMESQGVRTINAEPAGGITDNTVAPFSVDQLNICEVYD
ncbi:hypothetical protein ACLMJK_002900 [Lecanora helva]